jgi:hypothetical protein
MTTLHLGVIDLPYRHVGPGFRGRGKKKRPAKSIGSKTTFEVAEILERRYHIMELFFEIHSDSIIQAIIDSYEGATESILMTKMVPLDPSATGMDKIKVMFQKFLDMEELAGVARGVPTQAAILGISHRFAHPYAQSRTRRPSFIDTGLYQSSFRAWVD